MIYFCNATGREHTAHSTQDNKEYTDLNKAHIMRRPALVHTMLQASVQLAVLCTAVEYCNTRLEQPKQSAL